MALELPGLGTTKVEAKPRAMPSLFSWRFDKNWKVGEERSKKMGSVFFVSSQDCLSKIILIESCDSYDLICNCSYDSTRRPSCSCKARGNWRHEKSWDENCN